MDKEENVIFNDNYLEPTLIIVSDVTSTPPAIRTKKIHVDMPKLKIKI